MAITTKILSDTKTHAKVLLTFDNDSATTAAAVDGSGLSGHANGAKLHINHINYGLTGRLKLEFKGSSSDIEAINLSGAGVYYGAVIKNTATNAGATGGDIAGTTVSATGYALLTLQKIDMGENS
jgi:hypothetical protein